MPQKRKRSEEPKIEDFKYYAKVETETGEHAAPLLFKPSNADLLKKFCTQLGDLSECTWRCEISH